MKNFTLLSLLIFLIPQVGYGNLDAIKIEILKNKVNLITHQNIKYDPSRLSYALFYCNKNYSTKNINRGKNNSCNKKISKIT